MKVSQNSTLAMHQALRQRMSGLQLGLVEAQKEVATGRVADAGLELGYYNGKRVSLLQDVERLNVIADTNAISKSRLDVTLNSTQAIKDLGGDLMSVLVANVGNSSTAHITTGAGRTVITALTNILNSTLDGDAIFGGINSSVPPIGDYDTGAKAQFATAFQTHFGYTITDPAALAIDEAAMETFLDTVAAPLFDSANWNANISSASDTRITARIGMVETVDASVSANEEGFRTMMFAAVIATELFGDNFTSAAQSAASKKALSLVGTANSQIANLEGEIGFKQARIQQATDQLNLQVDELTKHADQLVEVDAYEAATRLNSLITQIETSYTLTGRIQQLSLMRYV